ncbi:MAG: D-hexose-6-phosphate mutarotase [Caldilineaceae bacterium]|nr:D-hexose-6-phosphate mutarotase [Caldilineaceae bacterium]
MNHSLQRLNQRFALADALSFVAGPGDLPTARIHNRHARAEICLLGAHILSFQPHGEEPVLWMSRESNFAVGKAIRGGIPVCWPWFAGHPTDSSKPSHGFVRTALWSVTDTRNLANGETQIELGIESNEETLALWPHRFELRLRATVGTTLTVELISHNPGEEAFTYTGALHSYFTVGDSTEIAIHGLADGDYLDKTESFARKTQRGPIQISGPTDRIYLDTDTECVIDDPGLGRRIHIGKSNSHTTVVWNPWSSGAARLPDFGDDEYRGMVCVETARAAEDVATVPAGGEDRLTARIWIERE